MMFSSLPNEFSIIPGNAMSSMTVLCCNQNISGKVREAKGLDDPIV